MLNFLKRRRKIKTISEKDRHKPSIILNTNKEKGFKRHQLKSGQSGIKNFKGIMFGILGILLLLFIVFLINSFFTIETYKLNSISILGNKTISEAEIDFTLQKYKGKHIALLDTREIEDELTNTYRIIKGIQITKQYPNKLFIKINEREPKIVYISLNGAYVLDSVGKILNIISAQKVDFSEEKILISRDLGDLNSQILKDYFLNEFILTYKLGEKTITEREQFILAGYSFDIITEDQKRGVLKTLAIEYNKEIEDLYAKNSGIVLGSKYRDLPKVFGLQNEELDIDEPIDLERQNLTLELINRLNASKMDFVKIEWEGSILVKVYFKDGKQLIFGSRRPLSEQWEDYFLVLNDLAKRGKGYSVIDLSSTKISVIN